MQTGILTGLAGLMAILLLAPAAAADEAAASKQTSDIEVLGEFDIIIGDLGDRFDGWNDRDTRVWVEVYDGWRYHEHYFDSLPSMIFVLRQKYGRARITDLGVPEYSGLRHERHGHEGHGLIDGRRAWYVWDYEHYSRGGTPLVLAFWDYGDARDEARWRDADVLSYEETMRGLNDWSDWAEGRAYWRGWDHDRWRDHSRWNRAWDHRWKDSRWDRKTGWSGVTFRVGDFTFRWESDRHRRDSDRRDNDRYDRDRRDRDRDHRRYDRDRRDRDRDRDRDDDRERDNDRDKDRDRKDDRNRGSKRTQEK